MEERSTRPRGVPAADKLRDAKARFKNWESAKVEYQRLHELTKKKALTPESNSVEHARWVHICELNEKKGNICYFGFRLILKFVIFFLFHVSSG